MTETRMKAPPGCKSISQGRHRAIVGEDGHALVPEHLVGDAISHGFVVSHMPKNSAQISETKSPEKPQQSPQKPLMKPAMSGDSKSAAFDLPALRKVVPAAKPAPKPRKAEGSGKRQK